MKLAAIDIGTNTTLMLVAAADRDRVEVLAERAEITRLGRGIGGDGRLGREGIERTLAVLTEYAQLARQHGARIAAIGTEGLRCAPNAAEFLDPAAAILGVPVAVIDGDREALLSWRAAASAFPDAAAGTMAVIDIGGGSTEVIVAHARELKWHRSLPLGSVRLTERHVRHDPASDGEVAAIFAEAEAALAVVPWPPRATLIGIAGTVTTLCAMAQNLPSYDATRVHGHRLVATAIEAQATRLRRSTQAERERMAGLDPRRADVILAGACLLLAIMRRAGAGELLVSDRGIRWGLLHEQIH